MDAGAPDPSSQAPPFSNRRFKNRVVLGNTPEPAGPKTAKWIAGVRAVSVLARKNPGKSPV